MQPYEAPWIRSGTGPKPSMLLGHGPRRPFLGEGGQEAKYVLSTTRLGSMVLESQRPAAHCAFRLGVLRGQLNQDCVRFSVLAVGSLSSVAENRTRSDPWCRAGTSREANLPLENGRLEHSLTNPGGRCEQPERNCSENIVQRPFATFLTSSS